MKNPAKTSIELHIRRAHLFALGCLVSGTLLGAMSYQHVMAKQDAIGANLIIPYDGVLMVDGEPVTGTRGIQFDLYEDNDPTSLPVWSETQPAVEVYGGRFSVGLGTSTALTSRLLEAEKLYIGLTIQELNSSGAVTASIKLDGRQAIEPAPFAAMVGHGTNFQSAGSMRFEGGAALTGTATIGNGAAIFGDRTSAASPLTIKTAGTTQSMSIEATGLDSTDTLYLQQNVPTNGTRFYGDLTVLNDTTIGGTNYSDTAVVSGKPITSSSAALMIESTSSNKMLLDGTGVDIASGASALALNALSKQDVIVNGPLDIQGAWKPNATAWSSSLTGDGGAAIVNDTTAGSFEALMIVGSTTSTLSLSRLVTMFNDLRVNDALEVQGATQGGALTVNNALTVSSTVTHDELNCPGSPWGNAYNASMKSRLCAYKLSSGTNPDWNDAADLCWSSYGAELCTMNQMRVVLKYGGADLVVRANDNSNNGQATNWRFLRDFFDDDNVACLNNSGNENDIDTTCGKTQGLSGGYCCLVLSGY